MDSIFFEISIIFIIAALLASILRILRQPLIPAYVIAGIILGPIYGIVVSSDLIKALSEIGIAFLLFIVGLEIDFKKIKSVAGYALVGGVVKSLLMFAIGTHLGTWFGFSSTESFYLGLILAFSSTVVVVKLLSDKKKLDTLHARMVIGILLAEDFLAILAISMLSTMSFSLGGSAIILAKLIAMLLAAFILARFILSPLYKFAAQSQELLFLVSLSLSFLFTLLAANIGISIVIGAFIAGVALGNLPYTYEIIGRINPLKDFFSIIFFVSLGLALPIDTLSSLLKPFIILFFVVVIGKPLITMTISSLQGFKKKPSFLGAITLAQVSEFSLIIVAQGIILGHVSDELFTITVLLAVSTMALSSYFITFKDKIYELISPLLDIFEHLGRGDARHLEYIPSKIKPDIILFGYNRIGYSIMKKSKQLKKKILIVDYNPEVISHLIEKKIPCIYGDVGDPEILERVDFHTCKVLISTVPDANDNILILRKLRKKYTKMIMFVTANHLHEALELYDEGADYVVLPHFLGGDHISLMLERATFNIKKLLTHKKNHIKELHKRKKIGHIIRQ